jgi:DNA repair exonuclease SbcCD ATPase subunit
LFYFTHSRSKQALGNLNEEIDRLRDIVEKNHAALHNQTHDRQTLSEQFDNLLNSFNACKEERNTLAAELSRVQDELKQLKEDTQHGLEQQEKSKKKVAALREEREALKLQCAQQDAAIESAKQQIAELEASLKEFLESRKTVEAAVRAVKAQNEELMQQLAAAREQAACSITTLEVIPDDIRNSFEVKRSPPRLGRLMSPCRSRSPLRRTSGGGAGGGTNSASSSMDSLPSPLPPSEKRDRELRGRSVSFSHSGEFSCSN